MQIIPKLLLLAGIILAPLSSDLRAQERPRGWSVTVGAATIYAPSYLGSDDSALLQLPSIRIAYADNFFASVEGGVGYNAINQGGWKVGPVARYDFGRREDDDNPFRISGARSDDLRGLGDIDGGIELGGFVEYGFENLTVKTELRQALNGHEGFVADAELTYSTVVRGFGPPLIVSFGPRLKFADSNFNGAYFGIDTVQSVASSLAAYRASSGIVSYGVGAVMIVPVVANVSLTLFAGYDILGNVPADSPLVELRGSRHQSSAGIAIGYRF